MLRPGKQLNQLQIWRENCFDVPIDQGGSYALFTQHHPDELQSRPLHNSACSLRWQPGSTSPITHDDAVTSVGITVAGDLHRDKFQAWLSDLLQIRGRTFRSKGILSIKGSAEPSSSRAFTCCSIAKKIGPGATSRVTTH